MRALPLLLWVLSSPVWAEACVVQGEGEGVQVQLCQANRSIPARLFREGFCAPRLKGQQVQVRFVEQCPEGAIGICQGARVQGAPYRQDIHYYGVAGDSRYLQPACERLSDGRWLAP